MENKNQKKLREEDQLHWMLKLKKLKKRQQKLKAFQLAVNN